jgi:hypothetical protein
MSRKALVLAVLFVLFGANAAFAQAPAAPPGPAVSWDQGNVRGIQLRRGRGLDYLYAYTVVVPEGTAGSYSISIDICKYKPVKNNVPTEVDSCTSTGESDVQALGEVEPGRVYAGAIRFGYDPQSVEFGKVNRYTFTLTLRRIDGENPGQVVATAEFNDVIFALRNKPAE